MDKNIIKEHFDLISDEFLDNKNLQLYLYALRVTNIKGSDNPLMSLSYSAYDSQMKPKDIKESLKIILQYTKKKYIDNPETIYEEYKPINPKTVVDCLNLTKLDFNNQSIANGTQKGMEPNNYKVQYLLDALTTSNQITGNELKNFKGIKYTVITCFDDKNNITIINKGNPIYKPKKILFSLDTDDPENFQYNPYKQSLFKIPFYPGVLIINDLCLFIADKIETLFGFSEQVKILKNEKLDEIKSSNFFDSNSFKQISTFANTGKNYNYFSTFDNNRLNKIKKSDKETISKLTNIGIKIQSDKPIIENINDAEKILAYICHVLKKDVDNEDELSISLNNKIINT